MLKDNSNKNVRNCTLTKRNIKKTYDVKKGELNLIIAKTFKKYYYEM